MGLLILAIFGIICAVLAHFKGRSVIAWFFIGFFFHIFGLIIVLVVSNLKEAKEKEEHFEMEQRRLREQLRQEQIKTEQLRKFTNLRLDVHDKELGLDTRHREHLLEQANIQPLLGDEQGPFKEAAHAVPETKERRIKTQCPDCQARFNVSYEHEGKTAKCPKCNKPFVVTRCVESMAVEKCASCGRRIGEREQACISKGRILCQQCHERTGKESISTKTETEGWYYQERDNSVGPLSFNILKRLVHEGKINALTYVWHESLSEWTPAGKVDKLDMETEDG